VEYEQDGKSGGGGLEELRNCSPNAHFLNLGSYKLNSACARICIHTCIPHTGIHYALVLNDVNGIYIDWLPPI
ncbi:uncharacterized protein METZ01_LOCUS385110, partial [marine metagenome]